MSNKQKEKCNICNEPPLFFCKCEDAERICKNGHRWYYSSDGKRIEGSTHLIY